MRNNAKFRHIQKRPLLVSVFFLLCAIAITVWWVLILLTTQPNIHLSDANLLTMLSIIGIGLFINVAVEASTYFNLRHIKDNMAVSEFALVNSVLRTVTYSLFLFATITISAFVSATYSVNFSVSEVVISCIAVIFTQILFDIYVHAEFAGTMKPLSLFEYKIAIAICRIVLYLVVACGGLYLFF